MFLDSVYMADRFERLLSTGLVLKLSTLLFPKSCPRCFSAPHVPHNFNFERHPRNCLTICLPVHFGS